MSRVIERRKTRTITTIYGHYKPERGTVMTLRELRMQIEGLSDDAFVMLDGRDVSALEFEQVTEL